MENGHRSKDCSMHKPPIMRSLAAIMALSVSVAPAMAQPSAPQATAWPSPEMDALEPLYALAPKASGAAFYRSLERRTSDGRIEMWVVTLLRQTVRDDKGSFDSATTLYSIDCQQRTIQALRGQRFLNYVPALNKASEALSRPGQGSVGEMIVIHACDNPPLPPFGGSMAQLRRTVALAAAPAPPAPPVASPPAPVKPAAPLPPNCVSSGVCYYAVVAHFNDEYDANQRSYDGTRLGWGIRVSDTANNVYSVPFTICGKQVYARPSDETRIRGYLKPTSEAYARRFSLSPYDGGFPICAWAPPRYTGPNR